MYTLREISSACYNLRLLQSYNKLLNNHSFVSISNKFTTEKVYCNLLGVTLLNNNFSQCRFTHVTICIIQAVALLTLLSCTTIPF